MKNKIVILLLIISIILIGLVCNLLNPNEKLLGERQILKEMSSTDREQELDDEITQLNNSATEYANYVQNCKAQIANAITEQGIVTSETDSIDVVVENIKKLKSSEKKYLLKDGIAQVDSLSSTTKSYATYSYDETKGCLKMNSTSTVEHAYVMFTETINFDDINGLYINSFGNISAGLYLNEATGIHRNTVVNNGATYIDCSEISGEQYIYLGLNAYSAGDVNGIYVKDIWYD